MGHTLNQVNWNFMKPLKNTVETRFSIDKEAEL